MATFFFFCTYPFLIDIAYNSGNGKMLQEALTCKYLCDTLNPSLLYDKHVCRKAEETLLSISLHRIHLAQRLLLNLELRIQSVSVLFPVFILHSTERVFLTGDTSVCACV